LKVLFAEFLPDPHINEPIYNCHAIFIILLQIGEDRVGVHRIFSVLERKS